MLKPKHCRIIKFFTSRGVTSNIVGRGAGVAGLSAAGSRSNIETTGNGNNKGFPRNLKTNNFFLPPSLKWMKSNKTAASNSLATSPVIFGKDVTRYVLLYRFDLVGFPFQVNSFTASQIFYHVLKVLLGNKMKKKCLWTYSQFTLIHKFNQDTFWIVSWK